MYSSTIKQVNADKQEIKDNFYFPMWHPVYYQPFVLGTSSVLFHCAEMGSIYKVVVEAKWEQEAGFGVSM